jgi:hypothetical protein
LRQSTGEHTTLQGGGIPFCASVSRCARPLFSLLSRLSFQTLQRNTCTSQSSPILFAPACGSCVCYECFESRQGLNRCGARRSVRRRADCWNVDLGEASSATQLWQVTHFSTLSLVFTLWGSSVWGSSRSLNRILCTCVRARRAGAFSVAIPVQILWCIALPMWCGNHGRSTGNVAAATAAPAPPPRPTPPNTGSVSWRPPPPRGLPANWGAYWSADRQAYYFYNKQTGSIVWEPPATVTTAADRRSVDFAIVLLMVMALSFVDTIFNGFAPPLDAPCTRLPHTRTHTHMHQLVFT